ncbi:DUF4157 domain-containing protein [Streptomyces sp. TLI_146]|uniref:eCIS core domain-containing protein n=1 Tax=Streptomyces sp. TLI_146 TaxID=1938858 RepID=UPI000C70402D|nr:DUF4157 domain-containing protein [Streptomyces sp. TLI_146]
MHARDKRPEKPERAPGTGVQRTPSLSGGAGRGPMSAARATALQGLAGNHVVARLLKEERHVHGAGCGHGDIGGAKGDADAARESEPVDRVALLNDAINSPSQPIADPLRKEAEAFYQIDLSPARVHSDIVAQRATAAMGAEAMTIGHHVFLPPQAARKKEIVGHEFSHLSDNLSGLQETGSANSDGIPVTDPGQGSERKASANGAAFAAGAGSTPSRGPRPPARPGGAVDSGGLSMPAQRAVNSVAGLVVARAKDEKSSRSSKSSKDNKPSSKSSSKPSKESKSSKDTRSSQESKSSKNKGSTGASNSSQVVRPSAASTKAPSRDEILTHLDRLAQRCTCKQNKKQWGLITKQIAIRYTRDYKNERDAQSLRHIVRRALAAVSHAEQQEREKAASAQGSAGPSGDAEATKSVQAIVEQEIQAATINGHLAFASNYNQSMLRLFQMLRELGEGGDDQLVTGGDALQTLVTTDYGDHEGVPEEEAGFDSESDSEAEETPALADAAKGKGKRPSGTRADKDTKRRRTEKGTEGDAPRSSRKIREAEGIRRNRQALLKVREGFMAEVRAMEAVQPDAMDVDGTPGNGFKRDNATLKALRETSHILLVDVSNEKAKMPSYRKYLADLLAPGKNPGYAYLLHSGESAKKMHAEQKLLQMLQNADFDGDTPHDPIHIRGSKRPCDACLAMLHYFEEEIGLHLVYNRRGNQLYKEAVDSGVRNLAGHDGSTTADVGEHLHGHLADPDRLMYASAPRQAHPAPAGNGLEEAETGAGGGMEQRYTVPEKVNLKGETVRVIPADAEILMKDDTPSNSEAEDIDESGLVSRTSALRIGNPLGSQAPTAKELKAERDAALKAQTDARRQVFEEETVPQLRRAAGEEFWALVEARAGKGGRYDYTFPDALRLKIRELTQDDAEMKNLIKERFSISAAALDKQMKKLDSKGKLATPLNRVQGAAEQLEARIPEKLKSLWLAKKAENAQLPPGQKPGHLHVKGEDVLTEDFKQFLAEMMQTWPTQISANSIADHLLLPQNSFKTWSKKFPKLG